MDRQAIPWEISQKLKQECLTTLPLCIHRSMCKRDGICHRFASRINIKVRVTHQVTFIRNETPYLLGKFDDFKAEYHSKFLEGCRRLNSNQVL